MRAPLIAALLLATPLPARAGVGWLVKCPFSHSNQDDPIVFPGLQGASHKHDFYGNVTTKYNSTYSSMVAGGTTCGTPGDTSGYWSPRPKRNGVQVQPVASYNGVSLRQEFYYRRDNYEASAVVEPFPAGFKMILGYAHATSTADAQAHGAKWGSEIYFGCSDNSPDVKSVTPINCSTGIISLHFQFPDCWDGVIVGGDEIATGHVKYPSGGACPAGFSRHLPRMFERYEWAVGPTTGALSFSSGPYYTAHSDFFNTWQQDVLIRLVRDCLNSGRDCGTDPQ
jgi:hypothetical protein